MGKERDKLIDESIKASVEQHLNKFLPGSPAHSDQGMHSGRQGLHSDGQNDYPGYIPGAWEGFKQHKARKRVVFYRYAATAAAAVLILFISVTLFIYPSADTSTQILSDLNEVQPARPQPSEPAEQPSAQPGAQPVEPGAQPSQPIDSKVQPVQPKTQPVQPADTKTQPVRPADTKIEPVQPADPKTQPVQPADPKALPVQPKTQPATQPAQLTTLPDPLLAQIAKTEALQDSTQQTTIITDVQEKPFMPLFPSSSLYASSDNQSSSRDKRRVRFGVNISPGFSSTLDGSSFNYAGGVNIDVPLGNNFSFSTGVQLEQQNIETKKYDRYGAVPSEHTKASLTNLDIPLNISWRFFSQKSVSYYIGAGLSSLAYLNESYKTTMYSQELNERVYSVAGESITTYQLEAVERVSVVSPDPSNELEFAGRVNLFFGYQQRITPKLNLHIEPYLKIPVTGIATQEYRFTTGGITCKISF